MWTAWLVDKLPTPIFVQPGNPSLGGVKTKGEYFGELIDTKRRGVIKI